MKFSRAFKTAVNTYNGPRLCISVTGGGVSIVELLKIPGSSRIVEKIEIPYGSESLSHIYDKVLTAAVSTHAVMALAHKAGEDVNLCRLVGITAALTTNRYRRGKNQAYFYIKDEGEVGTYWHIELEKIDENVYHKMSDAFIQDIREEEDEVVGQIALALALEDQSLLPDGYHPRMVQSPRM